MSEGADTKSNNKLRVHLTPDGFVRLNLWIIAGLLAFHLVGRVLRFTFGFDYAWGIVPLSNLSDEYNLASLYSSLLFFINAVVAYLLRINSVRTGAKELARFWGIASVVALFLGCDEILVLHERLDAPMHKLVTIPAIFHYAWTIPYLLGLFVLVGLVLPSFLKLPFGLRRQLLLAGAVFVLGAVGCEVLEGWIASKQGVLNFTYLSLATLEELLEMLGLTFSCAALWAHLLAEAGSLELLPATEHYGSATRGLSPNSK